MHNKVKSRMYVTDSRLTHFMMNDSRVWPRDDRDLDPCPNPAGVWNPDPETGIWDLENPNLVPNSESRFGIDHDLKVFGLSRFFHQKTEYFSFYVMN